MRRMSDTVPVVDPFVEAGGSATAPTKPARIPGPRRAPATEPATHEDIPAAVSTVASAPVTQPAPAVDFDEVARAVLDAVVPVIWANAIADGDVAAPKSLRSSRARAGNVQAMRSALTSWGHFAFRRIHRALEGKPRPFQGESSGPSKLQETGRS